MRREIPMYTGIAVCLIVTLDFFFKVPIIQQLSATLQNWVIVLSAAAMGLGATGLVLRQLRLITRKSPGWQYAYVLLAGLVLFPCVYLFVGGTKGKPWIFLYDNFFSASTSTLYSIQCMFVASAAYRTFTLKNAKAVVLLATGVLLMLGRAPLGEKIWSGFPLIADWLYGVVNGAAMRGIIIATSVGVVGLGIRYLIGLEKSSSGE